MRLQTKHERTDGEMKLSSYLSKVEKGGEVTVFDKDYDIEVYFYNSKRDLWDKTLYKLAGKLEVLEISENGITVNLSEVIENNLNNFGDLFYDNSTDTIMDDIENILSGCVSENWLCNFVNRLA